jgi:hypothetical protein
MPSRRIIKTGLILAALILPASRAAAAAYFGLDADRYSLTLKQQTASELFPQAASGLDLHFGDRFGNLAGEIGYGTSTYYGNAFTDNLHLTRMTADGILYFPIFGGFNILMTAGGAETNYGISSYVKNSYLVGEKTKYTNADVPVLEGNEFDWRAGAGFSFSLDEFELRVLARYQPLSMQDQAQNALSVSLGLNMNL